jgi:ABC-type amino acid transport system permease subunit
MSLRLIFNSLSISGAAMFAGVMFAIGVILGGYWRSLSPADFLEWFSRNNVFIMRAIPFVALPTFIGLGGSLWLGWNSGRAFSLKPIFLKPYLL